MNYKNIFLLMFLLFAEINAQYNNIGAGIGIGSFMGNFPSQTVFGGKLYYEFQSPFTYFDKLQFHLSAAQKLERFLPGNTRIEYFSYFYSAGTSIILVQNPNENFYVNEGLGLIYLNDRSFSDINTWNLGLLLSLNFTYQIDLHSKIGFNFDYGLTFTNTNSSYSLFLINYTYIL